MTEGQDSITFQALLKDEAFGKNIKNSESTFQIQISTKHPKRTPFLNLCLVVLPLLPSLLVSNPPKFTMLVEVNHCREHIYLGGCCTVTWRHVGDSVSPTYCIHSLFRISYIECMNYRYTCKNIFMECGLNKIE